MRFRNEFWFLSNMYPCPVTFNVDGVLRTYPCVESAFQACKCPERAIEFAELSGFDAKKLGRRVALRANWDRIKLGAMRRLLAAKFDQNPALAAQLVATGDIELVEDNNWGDSFWGRYNGSGRNELGQLLMAERVRQAEKQRAT